MKEIKEISPGLEQTIDAQYPVNFWLNWQKYRSIRCRERLQSFEDQKFYHNYNIHSAGMQDKLGYLLANLVYHIMVQAYKTNLSLLVLSGAGFGHHLLFFRGIDPKIVYSTCGSSAEDYIRTRYVLQGSSTNVI